MLPMITCSRDTYCTCNVVCFMRCEIHVIQSLMPFALALQTGNSDGFSTLRSSKMVSKQAAEWQIQSELREQMHGYKIMRQQHKAQVGAAVSVHACDELYCTM